MKNNPPTTTLRPCQTIKIGPRLAPVYDLWVDDSDGTLKWILRDHVVNGQHRIACHCPKGVLFLKYLLILDKPYTLANNKRQLFYFMRGSTRPLRLPSFIYVMSFPTCVNWEGRDDEIPNSSWDQTMKEEVICILQISFTQATIGGTMETTLS